MRIVLGTKNEGKLQEIKRLFNLNSIEFLTYQECPFSDISEDGQTYLENALKKARAISQEVRLPVLAEDSGLEVEALNGNPGIHSSRFAGEHASDEERIKKLLRMLKGSKDRRAKYRCAAALCFPNGKELIAEGELSGQIAEEPQGREGFGFDPVFIPDGFKETLGKLGPKIKDKISHRARALEKLKNLLPQ